MKIKYTKNFLKYTNLVRQNKVKFFVFDGLDGSGKGTLANLLCEHLVYNGYNVVFVELPDYSSPIGRLIKDMLKGSFNLVLNQTMALFALNRLEVLPAIILSALKLYTENNKDICVVFDRFVTSNILTIAYNYSKLLSVEYKNSFNDDKVIFEMLTKIYKQDDINTHFISLLNLDKYFLRLLRFSSKHPIFVPKIHPVDAIYRIRNDVSRVEVDKYENELVQSIADYLYKSFFTNFNYKFNICFLDQRDKRPEDVIYQAITYSSSSISPHNNSTLSKGEFLSVSYKNLEDMNLLMQYKLELNLVRHLILYLINSFNLNFINYTYEAVP